MDYKVTFHPNGGNLTGDSFIISENGYFSFPSDPKRNGYNFIGWYKDILGNKEFDITLDTPIDKDITIYAIYEPNTYLVTFLDVDYNVYDTEYVTHGNSISGLKSPYLEGYDFVGWYTDSDLTKRFTLSHQVKEDLELYPKFTPIQLNIWFDVSDGPTIPTQYVLYGEIPVQPEVPIYYGHSFDGFYKDYLYKEPYEFSDAITEDTTIYVKFIELTLKIEYLDENGDEIYPPRNISYGNVLYKPNDPIKTGKTFSHWEYNGIKYVFGQKIENDITLIAKYNGIFYTVTFDTNGGISSEYTQKVVYGSLAEPPEEITKEGSTFVCWCTTKSLSDIYNFDTQIKSDITLYAKWKIHTYNVIYMVDGEAYYTRVVNHGSTISNTAPIPTKKEYEFIGWYDENDNLFVFSKIILEDTYIYAKFSKKEVMLFFHSNGGSYVAPITMGIGESCSPPLDPVKEGYEFAGWYEDTNFRIEYNFDTLLTSAKMIYAKWDIETYNVTIHYNDNDNNVDDIEVKYGNTIAKPSNPILDGYSFVDWIDSNGNVFDFSKPITDDTIIEAKYDVYVSGTNCDFLGMINSGEYFRGDDVGDALYTFIESYVKDNTVEGYTVCDMSLIYDWAASMLGYFRGSTYYKLDYKDGILRYVEKQVTYNIPMTEAQLAILTAHFFGGSRITRAEKILTANYIKDCYNDVKKGNISPIYN